MVRQPAPETLRRALVRHRFTAISDGTLLDQYVRQADQDAFAELFDAIRQDWPDVPYQ